VRKIALTLVLALLALLLLGCGQAPAPETEEQAPVEEASGSAEFPARDPSDPLTVGEKATIILGTGSDISLLVQRADGQTLFELPIKSNTVIDPNTAFTVQTFEVGVPEELADQYVAVGGMALELHAAQESGYGFALKPNLTIYYTQEELDAARAEGANLDPLKGNLLVLYKEQRSPRWAVMTTVSINEASSAVIISNIAGAGAWRLVAKK
jgi:hypothetical protein